MIFCATVDDVCLDGYSSEKHFEGLLRFYEDEDVRATFFVVPRAAGIPLKDRPGYTGLLKHAVAQGHAVGQHGLEHDRFESGIPPRMILDLPHEAPFRERLARERQSIEENLQIPALRERLDTGRRILEDALGSEILGFRAPCLSVCDNLFHALEAEGFEYDSSRQLQDGGWDLIANKAFLPRSIRREDFDRSQYPGKMRTLPLTTEYTWYLGREKFDVTFDLARHDFMSCLNAAIPFVPVAHVSPIYECENGCGFDMYRRVLEFAREQSATKGEGLEMLNLHEACEQVFPEPA